MIFVATIVAPGVLLAIYGVRALYFERRVAEQETQRALEASAEALERRLDLELTGWRSAAERQEPISGSTDDSRQFVILRKEGGRIRASPPRALLYRVDAGPNHFAPAPAAIGEAERLEIRDHNFQEAVSAYRRLAESAGGPLRAFALHGLARTLRKTGNSQDATATYQLLLKEPVTTIGSLPSDLLALYGSGEFPTLYGELVRGRWQLEKESYQFYSQSAREKTPPGVEKSQLESIEALKQALTVAVERYLTRPWSFDAGPDGYFLAFSSGEPLRAIVLGEPFLRERVWPQVFGRADVRFLLTGPGGRPLFGEPVAGNAPSVRRAYTSGDLALRLQVWSDDDSFHLARGRRQQTFYMGMLAVVVSLLGFGAYLMIRMVRTELATAQVRSDFVSTVSHEFRTPLAGINQLGEMLRDGRVKDERRRQDYYEMIVAETQRLRRLVENVLDFARIDGGGKQYRFEPFEVAPWLRKVAADFQAEVAASEFQVEAAIPESLPTIHGDREALGTAIHNLLDNAVKYSAGFKTIWLDAAADSRGLSISVRDRGNGIAERHREHVFEKFYRGEAGDVKGVGLGLSLVKHIVASHGGIVELATVEGEGSTFTIHLASGVQA